MTRGSVLRYRLDRATHRLRSLDLSTGSDGLAKGMRTWTLSNRWRDLERPTLGSLQSSIKFKIEFLTLWVAADHIVDVASQVDDLLIDMAKLAEVRDCDEDWCEYGLALGRLALVLATLGGEKVRDAKAILAAILHLWEGRSQQATAECTTAAVTVVGLRIVRLWVGLKAEPVGRIAIDLSVPILDAYRALLETKDQEARQYIIAEAQALDAYLSGAREGLHSSDRSSLELLLGATSEGS